MKSLPLALALLATLSLARAADPAPALSASELASKLSAARDSGTAEIRLRMLIQAPAGETTSTLQLRIKESRTQGSNNAVYEVLFPPERKGESVFLRQKGGSAASGTVRLPNGKTQALSPSDAVFGSDLIVADAMDDFFAWKNQALVGSEKIGNVNCVILESKSGQASPYASVRSWIDLRRMVPLRVEKYLPSGKLARRIVTTRVVPDAGRQIPGDLKIESPDRHSQTMLDGSSIRHDIKLSESDFNPAP